MSKIFNDPIHGRIKIPDYCVKIIDTVAFQRLRNLKQLGLTSFVFPGATHTRFEHSIGVCYLSGKWAKHLQRSHPEQEITEDEIKTVMVAGLLHDIGHGPFSHTFERFIKMTNPNINYNHEDMTIKIISFISKDCGLEDKIIDNVINIIIGKPLHQHKYLAYIVHNTINGLDSDKLDYFIRDSQCTSFAIGCDWKRIIYESSIKDQEIVFPYKMVGDIFNLYQTRFRLYKELYYHKTVRMIEEIVLETLVLADSKVFDFNGCSLSESINSVPNFLLTTDDIIGQLERCHIPEITDKINVIKTRNFKDYQNYKLFKRKAHYGLSEENPLNFVKFIDKNGNYKNVEQDIIDSMCPLKFCINI